MLKGGDLGEPTVVPGSPDKSTLIKLISLDEDHDDIMPPKGDPLTKEQVSLISKWIKDNWPLIAGILKSGKSLDLENLDLNLPDWLVENWSEIVGIVEKLIELTGGV